MHRPTALPDPLDILPQVTEIRHRLGMAYREARILKSLLRLAERRLQHERISTLQVDVMHGDVRHA